MHAWLLLLIMRCAGAVRMPWGGCGAWRMQQKGSLLLLLFSCEAAAMVSCDAARVGCGMARLRALLLFGKCVRQQHGA